MALEMLFFRPRIYNVFGCIAPLVVFLLSLRVWYVRAALAPLLAPQAVALPFGARLMVGLVRAPRLHRLRAPCVNVSETSSDRNIAE